MCLELFITGTTAFVAHLVIRKLDMNPKVGFLVSFLVVFLWSIIDVVITSLSLALEPTSSLHPLHYHFSMKRFRLQFAWVTPEFLDFRQTYVDLWFLGLFRWEVRLIIVQLKLKGKCYVQRMYMVLTVKLRIIWKIIIRMWTIFKAI